VQPDPAFGLHLRVRHALIVVWAAGAPTGGTRLLPRTAPSDTLSTAPVIMRACFEASNQRRGAGLADSAVRGGSARRQHDEVLPAEWPTDLLDRAAVTEAAEVDRGEAQLLE
jgi:hypothetical protein